MNKLPDRIRIKDIARLADVSVGTVDRVIHGRSGVSEASRKATGLSTQYVCQCTCIQQEIHFRLPFA